jgi:hypothetical protein
MNHSTQTKASSKSCQTACFKSFIHKITWKFSAGSEQFSHQNKSEFSTGVQLPMLQLTSTASKSLTDNQKDVYIVTNTAVDAYTVAEHWQTNLVAVHPLCIQGLQADEHTTKSNAMTVLIYLQYTTYVVKTKHTDQSLMSHCMNKTSSMKDPMKNH